MLWKLGPRCVLLSAVLGKWDIRGISLEYLDELLDEYLGPYELLAAVLVKQVVFLKDHNLDYYWDTFLQSFHRLPSYQLRKIELFHHRLFQYFKFLPLWRICFRFGMDSSNL